MSGYWEIAMPELCAFTAAHVYVLGDYIDDPNEVYENDERGRVYVLSNDAPTYVNNNATRYPKPARTVARICDIPTSAMQLNGVSGLSPTQVVDHAYVRQQASYNLEDRDRLYNKMASRWVRPDALDVNGNPIQTDNKYVFKSEANLEKVDLLYHNEFRVTENLVPEVDPYTVYVEQIHDQGVRYRMNDIGIIMVGGYAFNYVVDAVNDNGGVTAATVTPTKTYTIHLANFSVESGGEGITTPYGTSPVTGNGTGLKLRLRISNYQSLLPKKGQLFDDLYALVQSYDGLWLYEYRIDQSSTSPIKLGRWIKTTQISEYEQSVSGDKPSLSSSDSIIATTMPHRNSIPVCKYGVNAEPTILDALTTATFINVIDQQKSPVTVPSSIEPPASKARVKVDLTKYYCNGLGTMTVGSHTNEAVMYALKTNGILRDNAFVCWRWNSATGDTISYGVIYNSLNNFLSTDKTTLLRKNDLAYPKYVNSNANTTVVWDVPDIGAMMWIYNPRYNKQEAYSVDPDTKELRVDRTVVSWKNVEIRNPSSTKPDSLFDSSGFCRYNICTNHPAYSYMKTDTSLNAQYEYVQIISAGTSLLNADKNTPLLGNWQLVFPRIHTFSFKDDANHVAFTPVPMQMIRGSNISPLSNVIDDVTGYTVDMKTLLLDQMNNGLRLRAFNPETSKWENVT